MCPYITKESFEVWFPGLVLQNIINLLARFTNGLHWKKIYGKPNKLAAWPKECAEHYGSPADFLAHPDHGYRRLFSRIDTSVYGNARSRVALKQRFLQWHAMRRDVRESLAKGRADPDSPIICADEDEFMQAWEQAQEQGGEGDDDDDDMDDDWAGGDS